MIRLICILAMLHSTLGDTLAVVTNQSPDRMRLLNISCTGVTVKTIASGSIYTAVLSPSGSEIYAWQGASTQYLVRYDNQFKTSTIVTSISATAGWQISKMVFSPDGSTLFLADGYNYYVFKYVLATGTFVNVAGTFGSRGSADGVAGAARFHSPFALAVSPLSSSFFLLVADLGNYVIRRIDQSNQVTTVAGSTGTSGSTDGGFSSNTLKGPKDVSIAPDATHAFIIDGVAGIRRLDLSTYAVTTLIAVDATTFSGPWGIAFVSDGSYLIVADSISNKVSKLVVNPLDASVLAGTGTLSNVDGTGLTATFARPGFVSTWGSGAQMCCPAGTYLNSLTCSQCSSCPAGDTCTFSGAMCAMG